MEAPDSPTLHERLAHLEAEVARSRAREQRVRRRRRLLLAALAFVPMAAYAVTLDVPYTFTNGTIADAEEVNANFAAVEGAVATIDGDITAVENAVASIPSQTLPICNFFAQGVGACPSDRVFMGWVGDGDLVSCDSSNSGGAGVPGDSNVCNLCCKLP